MAAPLIHSLNSSGAELVIGQHVRITNSQHVGHLQYGVIKSVGTTGDFVVKLDAPLNDETVELLCSLTDVTRTKVSQ